MAEEMRQCANDVLADGGGSFDGGSFETTDAAEDATNADAAAGDCANWEMLITFEGEKSVCALRYDKEMEAVRILLVRHKDGNLVPFEGSIDKNTFGALIAALFGLTKIELVPEDGGDGNVAYREKSKEER